MDLVRFPRINAGDLSPVLTIVITSVNGISAQQLNSSGYMKIAAAELEQLVLANMVLVPAGSFQMGSTSGDGDERPVHQVTISKPFYMGKYQVTQKEWYEVMGTTIRQQRDMADKSWPLRGEGDNYPMYYVNWLEAVEYCNKRSLKEGLTPAYGGSGNNISCDFKATGYRLPTEAEWEFAARGGNKDPMAYEYSGGNNVDAVGWYTGNSGSKTHPVGTIAPNSLGLYDMSGNVWEWCWDWYGNYSGSQTDPVGASSGTFRVRRGGSWIYAAGYLRSAYRGIITPAKRGYDLGFRLVRQ
jgi:formylglycine-generating enzyme required for sulfatase activity